MATVEGSGRGHRPSGPRGYLRFSLWTLLLLVTGAGLFFAGRASVTRSLLEAKREAAQARMKAEKAEKLAEAIRRRMLLLLGIRYEQRIPIGSSRVRLLDSSEAIEAGMKADAWEHEHGYPQLQPFDQRISPSPRFDSPEIIPLDNQSSVY